MSLRMTVCVAALSAVVAVPAAAQNANPSRERSPLDATGWGVVYDVPATRDVTVRANVPYQGTLTFDIYSPPGMKAGERRPAVVFMNAIGDDPGDKVKDWEIYRSWPRLVAAHGMVGISMDANPERVDESLAAAFRFLTEHGAEHGVDASRVGVYAASANVRGASRYLFGGSAEPGIRAAALYYGQAPEGAIRADLPVLFVVAESDLDWVGPGIGPLWQKVTETKAPWTLTFGAGLPHGFDAFEDTDSARRLIQQTLAFWKSHLEPVPAPPWQPSAARAVVSAAYWGDPRRSAELLSKWIASHPNDGAAHLQYGRALQEIGRTDEAEAAFSRALAIDANDFRAMAGLGGIRFAKKQWAEAADLLGRAADRGMRNSQVYGQLAFAQLSINRNEDAVRSYERAFEAGIPPGVATRGVAYYNLACGYARLGRTDKALDALSHAVDEGFADRAGMESDADLAPLRQSPKYREILGRMPSQRD